MIKAKDEKDQIKKFLEKIVVNTGVGRLSGQPNFEEKTLVQVSRDIGILTGQKPEVRRARRSIAGFKIREGQIIGLKVTLRRQKMVDFFLRLVKIVLPRVRDFNGLSLKSIDGGGVLSLGFKEQFAFPEVNPELSPVVFTLEVSLVPRIKDREAAIETLRRLGAPLKKK